MQARMATMLEVTCCWPQTRILGNAVPILPGYTLSRCFVHFLDPHWHVWGHAPGCRTLKIENGLDQNKY